MMGRRETDVDIPYLRSDCYKTVLFNSLAALRLLIRLQTATDGPHFFMFQATRVESVTDCEPHLRAPRL
jgi:hypothetical protein